MPIFLAAIKWGRGVALAAQVVAALGTAFAAVMAWRAARASADTITEMHRQDQAMWLQRVHKELRSLANVQDPKAIENVQWTLRSVLIRVNAALPRAHEVVNADPNRLLNLSKTDLTLSEPIGEVEAALRQVMASGS